MLQLSLPMLIGRLRLIDWDSQWATSGVSPLFKFSPGTSTERMANSTLAWQRTLEQQVECDLCIVALPVQCSTPLVVYWCSSAYRKNTQSFASDLVHLVAKVRAHRPSVGGWSQRMSQQIVFIWHGGPFSKLEFYAVASANQLST